MINEEILTDYYKLYIGVRGINYPSTLTKQHIYMLIRAKQLNDTHNLELNVGETSIKQVPKQKNLG